MAAKLLQGEFLLFMTQDAQPADDALLEELYRPFFRRKGLRFLRQAEAERGLPGAGAVYENVQLWRRGPDQDERGSSAAGNQDFLLFQCVRHVPEKGLPGAGRLSKPHDF